MPAPKLERAARTDLIDFHATEMAARLTVAAGWNAEATRYEIVAANSADEASRKSALLFAKDLRESAARLLGTIH